MERDIKQDSVLLIEVNLEFDKEVGTCEQKIGNKCDLYYLPELLT